MDKRNPGILPGRLRKGQMKGQAVVKRGGRQVRDRLTRKYPGWKIVQGLPEGF
jgi:hypothetical protein